MDNLRNFEISVWTLQDEFITVIEDSNNKLKGKTQNATINLNVDGTQELTFTIPMRISKNGELINNPAWQNAKGAIIVNTRKIKVILNKKFINSNNDLENDGIEEIYEFVIDKMTERHEEDQMYCDVVATGLAFYELGKIGYKISLSSDDFYADDLSWFKNETDESGKIKFLIQPIANLQYWVDKFLTKLKNEDNIFDNDFIGNKWYYTLQMNWENQFNYPEFFRSSHKIYEDSDEIKKEFTAMTTNIEDDPDPINQVGAIIYDENQVRYKEKARLVDLEESNIYNLTQNIAEIFGVYCKYQYVYDKYYHIIGRIVIFYNNFLYEDKPLTINYKIQTSSISRELDTTDLVTKMYVKTVDDNDNYISIIDVEDNPTGEDYLLNFDYMHSIGTIDDYQYQKIPEFQTKIKNLNNQLRPIQDAIGQLEVTKIDLEAQKATADAAITLDSEMIDQADALFNNLTDDNNEIAITALHPDSGVLRLMPGSSSLYYVKLSEQGIIPDSIQLFSNLKFSVTEPDNRVTGPISNFRCVYDDFGNLIQLDSIKKSNNTQSNIIYLTYKYRPKLYWENIKNTWQNRKNKDEYNLSILTKKLEELNTTLDNLNNSLNSLLKEKEEIIEEFNVDLGSAIREGYWQPENYSDTGDTYISTYYLDQGINPERGETTFDYFKWDTETYEGEEDIKYQFGVDQEFKYYYIVELNQPINHLDSVKVYPYNSYDNLPNQNQIVELVGSCFLGFVEVGGKIKLCLIFNNVNNFTDSMWEKAISRSCDITGSLITNGITGNTINIRGNIINMNKKENNKLIGEKYTLIHPRIFIESTSLKNSEDQLAISTTVETLTNFEDYYITSRYIESPHTEYFINNQIVHKKSINYVISIKPEALAPYLIYINSSFEFNDKLSILFTLSNADTAIYNDAKEIMRESSIPKVAYEISYNIFNKSYLFNPANYLNHIVDINDIELQFHNVRGYVSGITIDLDHPWNDVLEIKNYRTKFEDLFTTIFAQTEAMKKSSYIIENMSQAFNMEGQLKSSIVQDTLLNKDLNFAFNQGTLTINENDGIWGTSDDGVVAFRGGGIFTANKKDENDNWLWNTGITPEGINASLITTGQLDTNRIKIYAGDRLNFQFNEDGLYAYKSFMQDFDAININNFNSTQIQNYVDNISSKLLDPAQYVVFNKDGLFLTIKKNAWVLKYNEKGEPIGYENPNKDVDRVEISWRGLVLRNNNSDETFFADPNTGNLTIKGTIEATAGKIGPWSIGENSIYMYTQESSNIGENFDNDNIVYFGKQGLNFNNIFKLTLNTDWHKMESFIIYEKSDSSLSNNYLMRIEGDEKGNYNLDIGDANFGSTFIEKLKQQLNIRAINYKEEVEEDGYIRTRNSYFSSVIRNGDILICPHITIDSGTKYTIKATNSNNVATNVNYSTREDCKSANKNIQINNMTINYFNIYYNDNPSNSSFYFGKRSNQTYGFYFYIRTSSFLNNVKYINFTLTQNSYNGSTSKRMIMDHDIIVLKSNSDTDFAIGNASSFSSDTEDYNGLEAPVEEISFDLDGEINDDSASINISKESITLTASQKETLCDQSKGLIIAILPKTGVADYARITLSDISITYYQNGGTETIDYINIYTYVNGTWQYIT